jgi:hypothetical protein
MWKSTGNRRGGVQYYKQEKKPESINELWAPENQTFPKPENPVKLKLKLWSWFPFNEMNERG